MNRQQPNESRTQVDFNSEFKASDVFVNTDVTQKLV
jgi:hypothetical protein